jgi:hypothetical protein
VSFVYFVRDHSNGLIKIGFSRSPVSRLKSAGGTRTRELVGALAGTRADERAFHDRFAALRVSGEWFRPGPSLADFVGSLKPLALPEEDAVRQIRISRSTYREIVAWSKANEPHISLPNAIRYFLQTGMSAIDEEQRMTRTPDPTPPNGDAKPMTRAEAYARIARTLKSMASDAERRAVLASIATLYEAT